MLLLIGNTCSHTKTILLDSVSFFELMGKKKENLRHNLD